MNKPLCTFFSKTNSCKHGDDCIKTHKLLENSPCLVLKNLYFYPQNDTKNSLSDFEIQLHSEFFFEDIFTTLSLDYGEIKNLIIAQNSCKHILGNVYVQFESKSSAESAFLGLSTRTYFYSEIKVEKGAMFNISEGVCEDFLRRSCTKGGDCSYVHPIRISKKLIDELYLSQKYFLKRKII
ncbi:Splicing factor U2AF 26 kDa subunit [Nosema bombycis CQ1]|uniref:Splicing factor U2AF 26 kDa subunit n=1 Tax=Nosema bombycis (strain CQ1 / CVCC 102059) TaxID=578461 RepID=R0M7S5_NOSB1|nr:Splicing factor U2AF 26 kDa subunit [Nosema bombycis CQ1]|eukprot:EOB14044.1 Splicing factor U2AF 26 kDa subunit [Nosema bombycis CQ1]